MTLNDLVRRNGPYFAFFHGIRQIFRPIDYITVVEDRPILSVKYCLPVPVFYFWSLAEHLVKTAVAQKLCGGFC